MLAHSRSQSQHPSGEGVASGDNSIAFLQEQHARTLRGLHEEIQKLQQKCARLTFELTMKGEGGRGSHDAATKSVDLSLLQETERDSRAEVASLQSQLSAEREKTSFLEHQLQLLKQKLMDSTKEKEECIRTLNHELEERSSSIAHLITQLHQTKRLLHKTLESQRQVPTKPLIPHPPLLPSPPSVSPPEAAYRTGKITKRLRTCSSPVIEELGSSPRQLPTIPPYDSSPSPSPCPPLLPGRGTSSFPGTQSRASRPRVTLSHPLHAPITPSTWARHHPSPVQSPSPSPSYSKGSSETSQHLLSTNRTIHSKGLPPTVSQKSPPTGRARIVLPPIQSTSDRSNESLSMSKSDFPVRDPTVKPTAAVIARTGRGHRRLVLAKSQGLSSAPSSLRRLSYPPPRVLERDTKEMEEGEEDGEQGDRDEEEEMTEGTLVVRQGIGPQGNWRQLHQSHAK